MDFAVEIPCLSATLSHHVTSEISRYLLLLVIVGELDAEGVFQRRDDGAHALVREILAVGNHIEHVCLHIKLLDIRFDGDTRYLHSLSWRE